MTRSRVPALVALLCGSVIAGIAAPPQTAQIDVPVSVDYWQYFNAFNPNDRQLAPMFLVPAAYPADRRDAMTIFKFEPELPPGFPASFRVTAATVTYYDIPFAQWQPTGVTTPDGAPSRIELFAAGFTTYTEETWDGTQAYVGGTNTTKADRDPYPRDLVTDATVVEEVFNQTPWAVGVPVGYTPGAMSQAFPVVFTLDVDDPTIQAELVDDLERGMSTWLVSATYEDVEFGSAAGTIPNLVTREGVGSWPGSVAPTLSLTIEEVTTSVSDWMHH
jgi:hypothetical protein